MSDDKPESPPASLELQKTFLRVEEGELVRRNDAGGVAMRVPLDDVKAVRYVRELNTFALAAMLVAGGIAAIGYFVSEYNVVTVLLYVGAMFLGVFALFGLRGDVVLIRLRGQDVRIQLPDPTEEVVGFVASVTQMCGGGPGLR